MVEGVERVYLDDVTLHYGTQRAEFLLILTDLGTVRGFGLLDPLHELGYLFPGRIQLGVDAVIVGGKALVIVLEHLNLLGEVLFLIVELSHQLVLRSQNIDKSDCEHCGYCDHGDHHGLETTISLLLVFLAFKSLKWIFSFHNLSFLNYIGQK